mmetsp:Transcript_10160/g.17176  ORF Transcript_10160/g.17176 Transcript_10160/m.17176 type:complete len:159 (-) Transcript_10160:403-879(-)
MKIDIINDAFMLLAMQTFPATNTSWLNSFSFIMTSTFIILLYPPLTLTPSTTHTFSFSSSTPSHSQAFMKRRGHRHSVLSGTQATSISSSIRPLNSSSYALTQQISLSRFEPSLIIWLCRRAHVIEMASLEFSQYLNAAVSQTSPDHNTFTLMKTAFM